jgi:Holliday junction resolvase
MSSECGGQAGAVKVKLRGGARQPAKGNQWERNLAKRLREHGCGVVRLGQEVPDGGDLLVPLNGDRYMVIQAKAVEKANPAKHERWMKQVAEQAGQTSSNLKLKPGSVCGVVIRHNPSKVPGTGLHERYANAEVTMRLTDLEVLLRSATSQSQAKCPYRRKRYSDGRRP